MELLVDPPWQGQPGLLAVLDPLVQRGLAESPAMAAQMLAAVGHAGR
jgi:hypothetical protein